MTFGQEGHFDILIDEIERCARRFSKLPTKKIDKAPVVEVLTCLMWGAQDRSAVC